MFVMKETFLKLDGSCGIREHAVASSLSVIRLALVQHLTLQLSSS